MNKKPEPVSATAFGLEPEMQPVVDELRRRMADSPLPDKTEPEFDRLTAQKDAILAKRAESADLTPTLSALLADELDTLCQAIEGHRGGALTNAGLWHYHEKARAVLKSAALSPTSKPCNCGADLCIQQKSLLPGYACVRLVGIKALGSAALWPAPPPLKEDLEAKMVEARQAEAKSMAIGDSDGMSYHDGRATAYEGALAMLESAALSPSEAPVDEEMVPHTFVPMSSGNGNGEAGSVDEEIWCANCEYHRDHEIHKASAPLSPAAQEPLTSIESKLASAEAMLEMNVRELERLRNLFDNYGIPRFPLSATKARIQRMYRAWNVPGADESLAPLGTALSPDAKEKK